MATILIVDNEESIRSLISMISMIVMLIDKTHIALEAKNGQEGLSKYEQHNPDLIVTGSEMPVMSGLDLIKHLRDTDNRVKIIVHSVLFYRKEDYINMLQAGADLCLSKPSDPATIENAITNMLIPNYQLCYASPIALPTASPTASPPI